MIAVFYEISYKVVRSERITSRERALIKNPSTDRVREEGAQPGAYSAKPDSCAVYTYRGVHYFYRGRDWSARGSEKGKSNTLNRWLARVFVFVIDWGWGFFHHHQPPHDCGRSMRRRRFARETLFNDKITPRLFRAQRGKRDALAQVCFPRSVFVSKINELARRTK